MCYKIILILYFFSVFNINAQNFENIFESMSLEDRNWAMEHIDCIVKAVNVSKEVMFVMDSLNNEKFLGGNSEGGKFDAFRHIYWMYNLTGEIGEECARKIGEIYENYGYYVYSTTLNSGYDSVSMVMDLFNNELGILLCKEEICNHLIINKIEEIINLGNAKLIKKNQNGESLDVKDDVIPEEEWKKHWNNRRILINSNEL